MILISHRGNINGKTNNLENNPDYIDVALTKGYDVEVDVWYKNNVLWLGHDNPEYIVNFDWFLLRLPKLWIHCKNVESIIYFKECDYNFNFFWHEDDTITLTSKNYIWAYPGKQPIKNSIAVMPEIHNDDLNSCIGLCSDYVENYSKLK